MALNMQDIKTLVVADAIHWTDHVAKRLIKRCISPDEVLEVLHNGHIIEDYPADYPFPSYLVVGCTIHDRILHVVCSIVNDNYLSIITAYQPDPSKWDKTFTKRRTVYHD